MANSLLFTQQQLSGGQSYNCGALIGNWYEDVRYQENRKRYYESQKANGALLSQKIRGKVAFHNQPTELTPQHEDGYVHLGDTVMLQCSDTQGFVSVDLDDTMKICGHGTKYILTSSLSDRPKLRNTLVITAIPSPDDPVYPPEEANVLHYGQPFAIRFHPEIVCTQSKKPLFLHSEPSSGLGVYSKISRNQEVVGVPEGTYDLVWKCEYLEQDLRLEMEGQPIPANSALILTHCATNQPICSDKNIFYVNDFGREFELCCVSNRGTGTKKRCLPELPSNHWAFITAPPGSGGAEKENKAVQVEKKEAKSTIKPAVTYKEFPIVAKKVMDYLRQQILITVKSTLDTAAGGAAANTPASRTPMTVTSGKSKATPNGGVGSSKSSQITSGNPLRALMQSLKAIDNNGSRPLDRYELENALLLCGIKITRQELDVLMSVLSRDFTGLAGPRVYAVDFLTSIRDSIYNSTFFTNGQVDLDYRRSLVTQIFEKVVGSSDPNQTIPFIDLLKQYKYTSHPDIEDEIKQPIASKRKTAEKILQDFLLDWGIHNIEELEDKGNFLVSQRDFVEYYEDISLTITDDRYFELILQSTWPLSS